MYKLVLHTIMTSASNNKHQITISVWAVEL